MKKRKILYAILTCIISFMTFATVYAATIELAGTYVQVDGANVYKHYQKNGANIISNTPVVQITAGGNAAYCIDYGKNFSGGLINDNKKDLHDYVNDATYDRLSLIGYYGYGYTGHNTAKYYLATQRLVWKAIGGGTTGVDYNTLEFYTSSTTYHGGTKIDVSAEENEIERLITNHNKKPSFCGSTIEVTKGEAKTVTDSNGVLSNYTISNNNAGNITYTSNQNALTITGVTESTGNTLTFTKAGLEGMSYVYEGAYDTDSGNTFQNIYLSADVPSVACTVNVKVVGAPSSDVTNYGQIKIVKVDEDNNEVKLSGVTFEIYNASNALVKTAITDVNGEIKVTLPVGSYTVKETNTKKGYVLEKKSTTIVLDADEIKNLKFTNKKEKTPTNPDTGTIGIYIAWLIGASALGYTAYFLIKKY